MGVHEYIPGVSSATISSALIIGEDSWISLVGQDQANDYNSTTWIVRVDGVEGDALESLASQVSADARVSSVVDWSSTHKDVERNGGLIFGTPGLLSLQFVVASVAAVASSFVFLSPRVESAPEGTGRPASHRGFAQPNHSSRAV